MRNPHSIPGLTLLLIAGCALSRPLSSAQPCSPVTLAAYRHHTLLQMDGIYAPLIAYLSEQRGCPVHFSTSTSVARFAASLQALEYDVVLLGPVQYVRWARPHGYRALLGIPAVHGIFITAPGRPLRHVADLRGGRLGMPPPVDLITALAMQTLAEAGIDPLADIHITYVAEHDTCIRGALRGRFDACVTTSDATKVAALSAGGDYTTIGTTHTVPGPLFATSPSLDDGQRDFFAQAITEWQRHDAARLGWLTFRRVDEHDYAVLPIELDDSTSTPPESLLFPE